jgi:hypothetical protein
MDDCEKVRVGVVSKEGMKLWCTPPESRLAHETDRWTPVTILITVK